MSVHKGLPEEGSPEDLRGVESSLGGPLEAAIFDLDGLLVDSEPLWHEAEVRVLRSYGVPLTPDMCRETKGRYVSEAVAHWYERYPWGSAGIDVVVAEILDVLDGLVAEKLELKPGASTAVEQCHERGLALAIASSAPERLIRDVIARFDLGSAFDVACSAEHEAAGKPDPAVFITTARRLGAARGRCLVLEDSPAGVLAAKAAGMICVAVPENRAGEPELDDPAFSVADVVISSLEQFDASVWARIRIAPSDTVIVTTAHRPPERAPITIRPGDRLRTGERDTEWPAFVFVSTEQGGGWVPERLLETSGPSVTPLVEYCTKELAVEPGEPLTVVDADLGSGWVLCEDEGGEKGWVPARNVDPVGAPT